MRVISGIYKRRRFEVPRTFKARPTTDFAKENLFNVLGGYLDFEDGTVALDLFAGTGSISIELVSRGCDRVVSVEKDRRHHAFICDVMQQVKTDKCIPILGDALKYISRGGGESFDFIFADPPYALPELGELPQRVMESDMVSDDTLFVLEHGKNYDFSDRPDFLEHRAYGSVNFSFFRRRGVAEDE